MPKHVLICIILHLISSLTVFDVSRCINNVESDLFLTMHRLAVSNRLILRHR